MCRFLVGKKVARCGHNFFFPGVAAFAGILAGKLDPKEVSVFIKIRITVDIFIDAMMSAFRAVSRDGVFSVSVSANDSCSH